jgi:RNA polymerase-binding transcription factor DksA
MPACLNLEKLRSEIEKRIAAHSARPHKSALEADLQMLRSALRRMESGKYGYCLVCEEEIPAKRLASDPAIPTCLHCAIKAR